MIARAVTFLSPAPLLLAGGRRRRFRRGDLSLVYYDFPSAGGKTWVLLHGLAATAASCMPLLQALRGRARILLPELTRLGGTRCPGGGLNVREASRVLAALIEDTGEEPVAVGGMSLGGWIAVQLARDRPDLVQRLLLLDAAGYRDQDWNHVRDLVTVGTRKDAARLGRALFSHRAWLRPLIGSALRTFYSSDHVQRVLASLSEADTFGDEELRRITVPTDLIWGEEDLRVPPSVGEAMARSLPRGRLRLLAGCGHAAQWDRPAELVKTVRALDLS